MPRSSRIKLLDLIVATLEFHGGRIEDEKGYAVKVLKSLVPYSADASIASFRSSLRELALMGVVNREIVDKNGNKISNPQWHVGPRAFTRAIELLDRSAVNPEVLKLVKDATLKPANVALAQSHPLAPISAAPAKEIDFDNVDMSELADALLEKALKAIGNASQLQQQLTTQGEEIARLRNQVRQLTTQLASHKARQANSSSHLSSALRAAFSASEDTHGDRVG